MAESFMQPNESASNRAGARKRDGERPQDASRSRASLRTALLLFLLGTLTAATYAFVLYPRQGAVESVIDLNGFGKLGRHIANGEGFSLGYGPTLRRAPLYPTFVAALLTLFGNVGPDAQVFRPVQAVQCLILGLSCVTAWALGRKLFGERAGILAGVLCAITPQTLRYVSMTEVETLMGLFLALIALTGLNLYREPSVQNGVLFGMACAAATLTKPVTLLFPVVFALLCLWKWRKSGQSEEAKAGAKVALFPLAALFLAFFLCLFPWMLRNRIVSGGKFSGISSNAAGEFLRGYLNAQPKFAFLQQDFGGNDPTRLQWDAEANLYEEDLLRRHGMSFFSETQFGAHGERMPMEARSDLELKKDAIEGAEAKRKLLHEPLGFLRKFVIQIATFWYIVETRKKSVIVGAISFVALALALFGWTRARRQGIDTTPVVSVVLYCNLLYAAILAFARYSMPVFPTLLVLTAYGLTQLAGGRGEKASRQVLGGA